MSQQEMDRYTSCYDSKPGNPAGEYKFSYKKVANIEQGEDGMNKLTEAYLEALCEANEQYVTPHLND